MLIFPWYIYLVELNFIFLIASFLMRKKDL